MLMVLSQVGTTQLCSLNEIVESTQTNIDNYDTRETLVLTLPPEKVPSISVNTHSKMTQPS